MDRNSKVAVAAIILLLLLVAVAGWLVNRKKGCDARNDSCAVGCP